MAPRSVRFQEGMKVGFGYDLLNGAPLVSPAVQGTVSAIPQAQGQLVTSSFLRIDDLKTLHETIGVNVDAGGSYFSASADVKAQYAKECNMSQFATHVMVRVSVQNAFENFDDPALSTAADESLRNTGSTASDRFRERFGDVFIDGLQRGGEYFATFEIASVDQSVRETIATKVEAGFNGLLASAHLDVDVQNAAASSSSRVEVRVHVFQNGSIDRTDQTLQQIMDKARNFPITVAGNNAAVYAVSLADYNALKLPNDAFNFLDIQQQRDVLAEHAQKRFEFLTLRNSISYARQRPEEFIDANDAKLADELNRITDAINKMEKEASACLRDAKQCKFTPFDVSDFPLPRPKPPDKPVTPGNWATKAPLPAGRFDFGLAAASNGKLYASGGFEVNAPANGTNALDLNSNSWTRTAPPPPLPNSTSLLLVAANNGKLYAIDGGNCKPPVMMLEYDPETDTWETKAPMLTLRRGAGLAAAPNGKIYAAGGSVTVHATPFDLPQSVPDLDEYDPATNSWVAKAPMLTARSGVNLTAASNGKVYAFGGSVLGGGHITDLNDVVEEYDPTTNSWAERQRMPTRRTGYAVAAASNGKIYAVGGTTTGDDGGLPLVEEFDPATNSWSTKASMPTPRRRLALAAHPNGKLYAAGGLVQVHLTVTDFPTVEEFSP